MSAADQNAIRIKYYIDAICYMNKAEETLKKADKFDNQYKDAKYVKTACGIAYNGVLKALDGYFILKNISQPKGRKSVEYYQQNLSDLNKKMLDYYNNVYKILHLSGYYDGILDAIVISRGFEIVYDIIAKIKPLVNVTTAKPKKKIVSG
jgi:hypothetical protein